MTSRTVPLPMGEIGWLFPSLVDPARHQQLRRLFQAADEALYRLGQCMGAPTGAQPRDVPLNHLHYLRLGPEPNFPVTILAGEGGHGRICLDVLLSPAGLGPYQRPGPPWQVHTRIFLRCGVDDPGCGFAHQVNARTSPLVDTPIEAATELQAAIAWLHQRLANETEESLRRNDADRGHPPTPRRRD